MTVATAAANASANTVDVCGSADGKTMKQTEQIDFSLLQQFCSQVFYTIMLTSSCDKQEGSETLYLLVVGRA